MLYFVAPVSLTFLNQLTCTYSPVSVSTPSSGLEWKLYVRVGEHMIVVLLIDDQKMALDLI